MHNSRIEDVDGHTYPICALGILSSILKKVDVVGLKSLALLLEYFYTLWMHLFAIHDNVVVLNRCNEIGYQYMFVGGKVNTLGPS